MAASLKNFREKHGAFYFTHGRDESGRRKWMHLGRNREDALRRYASLVGVDAKEALAILHHLQKGYSAARGRARAAGIEFLLSRDEYYAIVRRSSFKCELTGIPFSLSWAGSTRRRPFVPSLDRRDSAKPYTVDNCRLVLCAVNYALNEWGETVLRKIAAALVEDASVGAR